MPDRISETMIEQKQPAGAKKNFWTGPRLALTFVALAMIAAIGIASCSSNHQEPAVAGGPSPGGVSINNQPSARNQPASLTLLPSNVRDASMKSVNGTAIKLSDYAGKVVLVNLWATWCGPCRNETPELVKLHKEFQSQGLEMVGLSTENPDRTEEGVKDFVREFQIDYRIGWVAPEVAETLMQGRDAIPQSFIISRDGHILKRFVGFSPTSTPPLMRQAITDALKG
jgi:glutathione peroxidase-family protein